MREWDGGMSSRVNNVSLGLGKLQHYSSSDVNPIKLLKPFDFSKLLDSPMALSLLLRIDYSQEAKTHCL